MRHWRCKCGNSTAFGSMPPAPCTRCESCGSDLASGPNLHQDPPSPHRVKRTRLRSDEGEAYNVRCTRCFLPLSEIERLGEPYEVIE